jgi:hypothetical protein
MEILTENPFTGTYKIRTTRVFQTQESLLKQLNASKDTTPYREFEMTTKVAVYPNKDFIDVLLKMGKPVTLKLYIYIINRCLEKGIDFIELKPDKTQEALDIGRMNLYKGIEELRSFRFIAPRKGRASYWINTELAFMGDRVEYLYKSSPESVKWVKTLTN